MRPLCKTCVHRPRAINYYKQGRAYYRTLCEICLSHGAGAHIPRWQRAGYKPKPVCDKCGYRSQHIEVFRVFHVDENLNNCRPGNLKTV